MNHQEELLQKRFLELARIAQERGIYTHTGFLSLGEIALFQSLRTKLGGVNYALWGGMEGCERQMLRFGSPELCGYEQEFPIQCLYVVPRSKKFAEPLTHRDFLGALMHLGVERSTMGDIVVQDPAAYLFCTQAIAPFLMEEFTQVKHTYVSCSPAQELPAGALYETREETLCVASERADGIIARAYGLSREESLTLFRGQRVFLNGALCGNNSAALKPEDLVSVRGYGRFRYGGLVRVSKKGKLQVTIHRYLG